MSYRKDSTYISFYYSIEELFDRVKMDSIYRAKFIDDPRGGLDRYSIGEDERDFFLTRLRQCHTEIFLALSFMSKATADANIIEYTDATSTSWDESESLTFVIEFPTYWDDNMTTGIDHKIVELISAYILKDWFKIAGKKDIAFEIEAEYNKQLGELKHLSVLRRENLVKKPYKTF
jgi:hypothetical protein